jgi:hypothetical protein
MAHSRSPIRQLQRGGSDTYRYLQRQIEDLRDDIAAASGGVTRQSQHAFDEFGHHAVEFMDEAVKQGGVAADQVSRQLVATGKAVQRDPVPVLVAIGTLALISSLLMNRRR